jgi:hypothetical protein
LVETLASIDVMVHQLVDHLEGSRVMRCWVFPTASWWRRLRRTGCWIKLSHPCNRWPGAGEAIPSPQVNHRSFYFYKNATLIV